MYLTKCVFAADHAALTKVATNLEYSGNSLNLENSGNSVQPQKNYNKIIIVRSNIRVK